LYYQDAIEATSTKQAPWYIIPADKKWFAHLIVSEIIVKTMESLKLEYPIISKKQKFVLKGFKQLLLKRE
jgi:hypothetical protein